MARTPSNVRRVAERSLRERLADGRLSPGARIPSEVALAADLNVTRTIVRNVLLDLEREGLVSGGDHRGRVAMGTPTTTTILSDTLVLVSAWRGSGASEALVPGSEHEVEVAIHRACASEHRCVMSMTPAALDDARAQLLVRLGIRGVIISGTAGVIPAGLPTLVTAGISVVSDMLSMPVGIDRVVVDHAAGCSALVSAVQRHGCRRVARIWSTTGAWWQAERDRGYLDATALLGLVQLPSVYALDLPSRGSSHDNFMARTRAYARWLGPLLTVSDPIDAVLATSDSDVFPLHAALRLYGKIPGQDVVVAGFDGYAASCHEIEWESAMPFASIDKDNYDIGRQLFEVVSSRIQGAISGPAIERRCVPRRITFPASSSTG